MWCGWKGLLMMNRKVRHKQSKRAKLICCLGSREEVFRSPNSVSNPEPSQIQIEDYAGSTVLKPRGYFRFPIVYHADRVEDGNICLMFVYRLVRSILPAEGQSSDWTPTQRVTEGLGRHERRFLFKSSQRSRFRSCQNREEAATPSFC